ncbi:MAG: UDP-N-acetylglucosamine 2-epimerase [Planctomycetes bacterium RBG_13_63_9]|nr:MAG: UDP-N-acetylglucosamine 2-epimerase [Planctomycetes bacterium RBG_13_63_9]
MRPLLILGTRPEAIKLAPVIEQCRRRSDLIEPTVCLTGQHCELLDQATEYFGIQADIRLELMRPDQSLAELTARCVEQIDQVLRRLEPDCVVVQGDTTSVMAASLAAFYRRIPLVHVEAGLRSGDLRAPWPEELNRRITDSIAALHCAPTRRAADALLAEGALPETVHVTGNTVVDAVLQTIERERANAATWRRKYAMLGQRPLVLITAHRRESFGEPLEDICRAVGTLADRFADHCFVWPVHPNPNVQALVNRLLQGRPNVHPIPPAAYGEFVWLMDRSRLILTDSGGVQEEAPSLGKPVLVMREVTERPEAVEAGAARLVGTSVEKIVEAATVLLTDPAEYAACQIEQNPFGDGHAAERIVEWMLAGTATNRPTRS